MYDLTLYEYLKPNLKVCYLTVRKDETVIRCPFCGDSNEWNHAHFYINNTPPFKFYCQRCNTTGVFSKELLNTLNLFSKDMSMYLVKSVNDYKLKINRKYGNSYLNYFNNKKEPIVLPKQFNELELKKKKYFEDRLGFELNDYNIKKYRIILNLRDYFELNDIKITDINKKTLIYKLDISSIGFLLNDHNTICCRYLNPTDKRYFNLKIFDEEIMISKKFYSIQNKLDLQQPVFNINLTEGIFDIVSVFHNIYDEKLNINDIFISVNGKSFDFVLNHLMKLGVLNADINIYSDNDVNKKFFNKLKANNILSKFNGLNIYYNKKENEKDFGVTKDRIILNTPLII